MKKVINITLGHIVFAVEQDAYDALTVYLEGIKQHLAGNDDASEIVDDIETALAEKFTTRKRDEKNAVTNDDVSAVVAQMGVPADFGEVQGEAKAVPTSATTQSTNSETRKRLYRDTDDAIIAGVASGLARYFDVDPVVVRIIFFVSIFFNGLGLLAYIILWLVVPKAQTTTEKYAMRGEKVTLREITQRVKKNLAKVDTADKVTAPGTWAGLRPTFVKLFDVFGVLARGVIHILRYTIGLAFVLGGALGMAGMVIAYSVVLLSDKVLFPQDAQVALDTMLGSGLGMVAILSSFVMMIVPLQVLVIIGASMLGKRNYFSVKKAVSLAVVWIVAVIVAFTASALQLEQVMQKLNPEGFTKGQYEFQINVDDHGITLDTGNGSEPRILLGNTVAIYEGYSFGAESTVVTLANKGLTGSLKGEVRHMENLIELDLSYNDFTGLPAEVGQLQNLESLNLSYNQLTGLPQELGNLQNLAVLDLRGNDVSEHDLNIIRAQLPDSVVIYMD